MDGKSKIVVGLGLTLILAMVVFWVALVYLKLSLNKLCVWYYGSEAEWEARARTATRSTV
jgi:uncharacterized membrane protein